MCIRDSSLGIGNSTLGSDPGAYLDVRRNTLALNRQIFRVLNDTVYSFELCLVRCSLGQVPWICRYFLVDNGTCLMGSFTENVNVGLHTFTELFLLTYFIGSE